MSFVLATVLKDLRRHLRDPTSFLLWLGIPIAIAGMLRLAFGGDGGGSMPQPHVLVVDQDDTFLTGLLVGALGAEQGPKLPFRAESVTLEEGRARIDDGDGSALLIIPEGFTSALLYEEPCTLELITNPAQRILPGMIEEALTMLVDGAFYVQRVFGSPLRAMAAEPPEGRTTLANAEVARIATEINELMERSTALLAPPAVKVVVEVPEEAEDDDIGFGQLFFPSMLFMTLFFLAQGMSEDLWVEKQGGTLRRALTSPNAASAFLGGKLIAAVTLAAAVSCGGMLLAQVTFGVGVASLPLAVLWSAASATMLVLFLYLLQLYASSQRAGNLLANLVTMPLLMLGGSFFPFEVMPDGMAALGRMTPNGWALEELKAILVGTAEPASLALSLAGLVGVSALLFFLSVRRIAGAFARS